MVYKIFLNVYLFFLCINGMILVGEALIDTPISTPFDLSDTISATDQPNLFNATDQSNTLYSNVTGYDITNATTSSESGTLNPIDSLFYPIAILQMLVAVITGSFIADVLAIFGFPVVFIGVMYGIHGFLAIMTVVYFVTGRG